MADGGFRFDLDGGGARKADALFAGALTAVAVAAYIFFVRPTIWYSDYAEFAFRPAFFTPAHWPGHPYPTLVLYWAHLFGGSPAHLAGVIVALAAAFTVGVSFLSWRELGVRASLSAGAALAFAFTPAFWGDAAAGPEVYTLEAMAAALVLGLSVAAVRRADARYFYAAALIFGVALGDRVTFVLCAPLLAGAFALSPRRNASLAATACVLGISVYWLYFLRLGSFGDLRPGGPVLNLRTTWDYATLVFHLKFFKGLAPRDIPVGRYVFSHLVHELTYVGCGGVLAGVASFAAAKRLGGRVLGAAVFLTAAGFLWLFALYRSEPVEPYLLIPLLTLFTFFAVGAESAARAATRLRTPFPGNAARRRTGKTARYVPAAAAIAAFTWGVAAYNAYRNHESVDRRADRGGETFVRESLKIIPYEGVLLGDHSRFEPFAYYHFIVKARPDLTLSSIGPEAWRDAAALLAEGTLPFTGERRAPPRPWRPGREIFFANAYPGMRGTAGYEEVVVPENFLRHELARVPPGGYFVAALVDYRPPNLLSRKREDASGAFSFLTTCGRIPVAAKLGTAVVLVGRREGDDVRVYVVPRRGRARFAFRVPPAWGPEGRPLVSFAAEIAPSKKIRAFTLGLPTRRYHLAAPGVIFVPANGRFQPAGEPALYWGDSLNLHRIYHFTAPR